MDIRSSVGNGTGNMGLFGRPVWAAEKPRGRQEFFFMTPRSLGWMDFDAAQKINLDTQDGFMDFDGRQKK